QSEWGKEGFYFGIDEEGYPGIHFSINRKWISLVDSNRIELFKWTHLAVTYSKEKKVIVLYKNGNPVASKKILSGSVTLCQTLLTIGLNRQKMPPVEGRIRRGKWPSMFGIDGLIDELRIYGRTLTANEVKEIYNELSVSAKEPDMVERKLPKVPLSIDQNKFGAHYTKLDYYETWDNLWRVSDDADVVVTFDHFPINIISWRGISYGHYFVTENGKWIGDQSNEDYRLIPQPGEAEGCLEHMSDKQCRYSHVRIIENTDARVVIHWRYALVDSRYKFAPGVDGWGGWTDEYWAIYPDGIVVRYIPRGIVFGDGWVETMFLSEPGTVPENNVNLQALSVINLKGEIENLSWEYSSPETKLNNPVITMVNSKSQYKMFNIFPTGSSIEIFGGHSDRSHFHWWNHWPVSQITSDGRGATAPDRVAHSSLCWGAPSEHFLMYGITNKSLNDLLPLAKSWNNAAPIIEINGCSDSKYVQEERAYKLDADSTVLTFNLIASVNSPAINPAFIVRNWKGDRVKLKINSKSFQEDNNLRVGFVATNEGKNLIVWMNKEFYSKVIFEFNSN
ncbi:MAG: LamG domain-containing protein, partial [Ignavibacteriaceae bacterium]